MRIASVVGARPNFMKLAPVDRELAKRPDVEHVIVHTGQHYAPEMSATFFEELWIPAPDYHLGMGSGSHAAQTAAVMRQLEPVLVPLRPDMVLVYGDVNSTLAAALVAAKLGLRVGHVEAGLRSDDWTMPEEINRVVTDRLPSCCSFRRATPAPISWRRAAGGDHVPRCAVPHRATKHGAADRLQPRYQPLGTAAQRRDPHRRRAIGRAPP